MRILFALLLVLFGVFGGFVAGAYVTVTGILDIINIVQGEDGSVFWAVVKIIGGDFVAIVVMVLAGVSAMKMFKG